METPGAGTRSIIVIDDDPMMRRSLTDTFEAFGLSCRCYPSAESYLKSPDPALTSCLILDMNFPTMSGLELQRRLNAAKFTFPIIFFTGEMNPDIEARAREAGAADFVSKSSSPTHLVEAIERALATRPV